LCEVGAEEVIVVQGVEVEAEAEAEAAEAVEVVAAAAAVLLPLAPVRVRVVVEAAAAAVVLMVSGDIRAVAEVAEVAGSGSSEVVRQGNYAVDSDVDVDAAAAVVAVDQYSCPGGSVRHRSPSSPGVPLMSPPVSCRSPKPPRRRLLPDPTPRCLHLQPSPARTIVSISAKIGYRA
jgi:hypothetical protein